nr:winged helix-turn-helix domain-containing protein [Haloferax prahovense]
MKYPGDDRILELLSESGLILSPSVIAANLDYTRQHVSSRMGPLEEHGLIEKSGTGKGHYKITEKGQRYLDSELNKSDLSNE